MSLCIACGEYVPEGRNVCLMCERQPQNIATRLHFTVSRRTNALKRGVAFASAVLMFMVLIFWALAMSAPCEALGPVRHNITESTSLSTFTPHEEIVDSVKDSSSPPHV